MILYVLAKFPNVTETFIQNEILKLKKKGLNIMIAAIEEGEVFNLWVSDVTADDVIFYSRMKLIDKLSAHVYSFLNNGNYLKVIIGIFQKPDFSAKGVLKAIKVFSISICLLYKIRKADIKHLHAHFINFPSSIVVCLSKLTGIPYSISAHANDIYTSSKIDVVEKIINAKFLVTCTLANKKYLLNLDSAIDQNKIFSIYHGIDLSYCVTNPRKVTRSEYIKVLSVGRLVEKKGLIYLCEAIKILNDRGVKVKCTIVGDGPLKNSLTDWVENNGIEDLIEFYGFLSHSEIMRLFKKFDFFVLPCKVCNDGDRDGIPNVLVEAMSQGIPVISTPAGSVSELIQDKITGTLVKSEDSLALAEAMMELSRDIERQNMLSKNGLKKIKDDFNIDLSISQLEGLFSTVKQD